jgi:hypothetical protein
MSLQAMEDIGARMCNRSKAPVWQSQEARRIGEFWGSLRNPTFAENKKGAISEFPLWSKKRWGTFDWNLTGNGIRRGT